MKMYYLQPTWDIVPDEKGVSLISTASETIRLENYNNYPPLIELFSALVKGASFDELKKAQFVPDEQLKRLLSELATIELVVSKKPEPNKTKSNNYLDLLNNYIAGLGKVVTQSKRVPIAKSNPFFGKLTAAKSLGFGPHFIAHQSSLNEGWGADTNPILTDIKAIVEGAERYALGDYDLCGLTLASWQEMKGKTLTTKQLGTTEQRIKSAGQIHWAKLNKIDDKKELFVPIDFTYHPVDYYQLGRDPVCPMNISGVAAHQTREAAITNALLELCEHEALMVVWFGKRTCPIIDITTIDPLQQEYITSLERIGWKVILKDISLDLAPVVMAVAIGPAGKRALTIGSCAAFSLKYAVGKALSEVIRTILDDEAIKPSFNRMSKDQVDDTFTHGLYYADHDHLSEAAYLWEGGEVIAANDCLTHGSHKGKELAEMIKLWEQRDNPHHKELEYLVKDVFGQAGLDIYVSDMTPEQVRQSEIPLVVMRALVPEVARFVVGHTEPPAITNRLTKLLKKYSKGKLTGTKLSPHPFS